MVIATGKQFYVYIWIEIPINKQVIQRVDELATKGKPPEITKGYYIFELILEVPIMGQDTSKPENEQT